MSRNGTVPLQGWTSSPNGRGTSDILSNSCLTLILCTWTVLCLNVYPPSYGRWKSAFRKSLMAGFTFFGPEFVFQLALGQWCSADRSVKKFRESGYQGWSMKHAFFADMGGFILHPRLSETEQWHSFPLDTEQVHYLVINDYLTYSAVHVDKEIIEDKNKVDGLLRLITVCQILWYLIATVSRGIQGLTMTLLELATIGFIICTLGTYFCWFHKPMDIGRGFILEPNATLQEILLKAKNPSASAIIQEIMAGPGEPTQKSYKKTPLDFTRRPEWSWNLNWDYCMAIFERFGIRLFAKKRPIVKIPDDDFPEMSHIASCVAFLVHTGYAAIHIAGWDFCFVTQTEKMLWRIATLGVMISILIFWNIHLFWWVLPSMLTPREPPEPKQVNRISTVDSLSNKESPRMLPSLLDRLRSVAGGLKTIFLARDPATDIPYLVLVPVLMCCAVYITSRVYVILEGFISLRALPPDAYQSVDWTIWLPHF